MSQLTIAAVQMNSQPDLSVNLDLCRKYISDAASKGADLVALPENFAFMGNEWEKYLQGDLISEAVQQFLPKWAKEAGIYIMAGGFPVRAKSGKVYNRSILIDPHGNINAQYDKIHLFDVTLSKDEVYRESDTVEAGKPEPLVCELTIKNNDQDQLFRAGMTICYDLRFPELFRMLADKSADFIFVPAAFTQPTGRAHWEILLRSRAIENSLYIIAPAQTGLHGEKRKTHGHSMIIDPWGQILQNAGTEPGIILSEIDLTVTQEIRRKLPSLNHKVFSSII